jgi:hypothetical protein
MLIDNINNYCDYYDINGCEKIIEEGDKIIMSNSTKLCEKLNLCDELTLNNFVIQGPINVNLSIYHYYNNLIGYEIETSTKGDLVFSKKWTTTLIERYKYASFILHSGPHMFNNGTYIFSCNEDWNAPIVILKITTRNYVYYLNTTNGIIIERLNIVNNYIPKMPLSIKYKQNFSSNPSGEVINIYDPIYNGSLYMVNFNMETLFSYGIRQDPNKDGPPYYCALCYYSNIKSIKLEKLNLNFPKEPPTCHEALEMYCPTDNNKRETCLDCLVTNKKLLTDCSVLDEENWCDKNIIKVFH